MTRDDLSGYTLDQALDTIVELMNEKETSICENCKHYIGTINSYGLNEGVCMNMPIGSIHAWRVKHDFGCNKFERINNEH